MSSESECRVASNLELFVEGDVLQHRLFGHEPVLASETVERTPLSGDDAEENNAEPLGMEPLPLLGVV